MNCITKKGGYKKLLGTVALTLATLTMYAGPVQAQTPDLKDFSGFYVGGLLGYADGSYTSDVSEVIDHEPSGGLFGVQVGWSRPYGSILFGIDGDFAFSSIDGEDTITVQGYRSDVSHDINYLSSIRARLGFMAGPVLLYGTAGLGMADLDNKLVVSAGGQHVGSDEESSWHTGWTAGVGIEYPMTANLVVGAEYLYFDMGKEEVTMDIGGYPMTDKGNLDLNTFRVTLKYRF